MESENSKENTNNNNKDKTNNNITILIICHRTSLKVTKQMIKPISDLLILRYIPVKIYFQEKE